MPNSGGTLVLRDSVGRVIDVFIYKSTEKNIAIERKDLDNLSLLADNQDKATDEKGGTPGKENSIKTSNKDILPPSIEVKLNAARDTIFFTANEPIDTARFERRAKVNGKDYALTLAEFDELTLSKLIFAINNTLATYSTVTLHGIYDLAGNEAKYEDVEFGTEPVKLLEANYRGCVVINEVMANPSDEMGLPKSEYIEIFNASGEAIDLTNWTIATETRTGILPSYILQAGVYAVLTASNAAKNFAEFGTALPLSQWTATALSNTRGELTLRDASGRIIDYLLYESSQLGEEKQKGGWSLERISPYDLSLQRSNYAASTSNEGGTPCAQNSIFAEMGDNEKPFITSALLNNKTLIINYNEPIDTTSIYKTIKLNGANVAVSLAEKDDKTLQRFVFTIADDIRHGVVYEMRVPKVLDLAGNESDEELINIGIKEVAEAGDALIINEIMSAADPAKADFVEIYNASNKIIDINTLSFARLKDGVISNIYNISNQQKSLLPGDYLVLTADSALVTETFDVLYPDKVVNMSNFPSLSTDESEIAITTREGNILDKILYTKQMHNPLKRSDHTNVSLERISLSAPTEDESNWTSAAASYHFATPTAPNSQRRDSVATNKAEITIARTLFTPDGDGRDDNLMISTTFTDGLWFATLRIFNTAGDEVACPYNNEALPSTGEILWDGHNSEGAALRPGAYILHISAWQTGGKVKEFKRTCVIGVTKK